MTLTKHPLKDNRRAAVEPLIARRFINETQLSNLTGVAVGTWQKKRVIGGGPQYRKIGGAVRYDLTEVLAWIDAGTRGGKTAA